MERKWCFDCNVPMHWMQARGKPKPIGEAPEVQGYYLCPKCWKPEHYVRISRRLKRKMEQEHDYD